MFINHAMDHIHHYGTTKLRNLVCNHYPRCWKNFQQFDVGCLGLISNLMGWQVDGEHILAHSSCFVACMITLYTYHIQNYMITWHVYMYDILPMNLLCEN
jgi:hypothetical protein